MLRRLTALIVLLAVAASFGEAVAGVARDGLVHQDQLAVAASSAEAAVAGAHDYTGQPQPDRSDDRGEHAPDHCTHQHGTPLVAPRVLLAAVLPSFFETFQEPISWRDRYTEPLFHPPQA